MKTSDFHVNPLYIAGFSRYKEGVDLWRFFIASLSKAAPSAVLQTIDFAREMDISIAMARCPLQDPLRFRARFLALQVAEVLIDDRGALKLDLAKALHFELESAPYLIGPQLEDDALLLHHIRISLNYLIDSDKARSLLNRFSTPLCHKGADRLIRDTLWPRPIKKITESDVKKAVLAAWLTWLRQTTGSCFATAPAIVIQQEQPLLFLQDLFDLLIFGSLKRVVSGYEYLVPLCPSLDGADLLRSLDPYSKEALSHAPGLKAAFAAAGLRGVRIDSFLEARTPKELIELALMKALGLNSKQIEDEEGLKKNEMTALLAKQSAVYYQAPSERSKKVSEWKEKKTAAFTAYQSLGDCALLRVWESTVASFSDVKVDVGRWNLYVSLGMHPDHPGGVGAFLYERINVRLQILNERLHSLQSEYNQALQIAKTAQRQQLEREYTTAMYSVNALVEQSQQLSKESEKLSQLFAVMIQGYDKLIPDSFLEVFDPSLATELADMVDDSPAGFRLVYKHGRKDSSQWTFIRNSDEFIASIRDFFTSAERELSVEYSAERNWIENLSTELIQYIQTEDFLVGAMARVKSNPSMQGGAAKPWEYISGGTMPALMMTYFNRSEPFTVAEGKIKTEIELLSFLTEHARISGSALMHSPTHAFIFRPDLLPADIQEAVAAMNRFWQSVKLEDEEWLAQSFATWLPLQEQSLFFHRWKLQNFGNSLQKFRLSLLQAMPKMRGDAQGMVDSFLYQSLPLMSPKTAISLAARIVGPCESFFADASYYTPQAFCQRVKAAALSKASSPLFAQDLDEQIAELLRSEGLAPSRPILFADTNWSVGFFGLAVSPAGKLCLWRFHRTGMTGTSMQAWFDLQREGQWIILTKPEEYRT